MTIPIRDSIAGLAGAYKVWLCDIWGVVHNGLTPFEQACKACTTFRAQGGIIVLISNSPRPSTGVLQQLRQIGVSDHTHDAIVTSGDVTRHFIAQWQGKPVYHLGPERDRGLFEGQDVKLAPFEEASVVVNTGLFDDETETPADYADLHARMLERKLPMICANPDVVVERGDRLIYCAGALADAYKEMGGEVIIGGKPHKPIYEMAMAEANRIAGATIDNADILAIGDSIRTDMTGAANAGIDALFVASGLHVEDRSSLTEQHLEAEFDDKPFRPVAAQAVLSW